MQIRTSPLARFFGAEDAGQGLSEYGLIIALVSLMLIGALIYFRERLLSMFGSNTEAMPVGPS